MKSLSVPKKLLIGTLLAAMTVALLWSGGILYWHLRLQGCIRTLEAFYSAHSGSIGGQDQGYVEQKTSLLIGSGCRSLPYLVDALNASKDSRLQSAVVDMIRRILMGPARPMTRERFAQLEEMETRWDFPPHAIEFERKKKIADFNAWWAENGARYHQPWRFWSNWCLGH